MMGRRINDSLVEFNGCCVIVALVCFFALVVRANTVDDWNLTNEEIIKELTDNKQVQSKEVTQFLSRAIDKTRTDSIEGKTRYFSIEQILDLLWVGENVDLCNNSEVVRRQEICNELDTISSLKNYCEKQLDVMRESCLSNQRGIFRACMAKINQPAKGELKEFLKQLSLSAVDEIDAEFARAVRPLFKSRSESRKTMIRAGCEQYFDEIAKCNLLLDDQLSAADMTVEVCNLIRRKSVNDTDHAEHI